MGQLGVAVLATFPTSCAHVRMHRYTGSRLRLLPLQKNDVGPM